MTIQHGYCANHLSRARSRALLAPCRVGTGALYETPISQFIVIEHPLKGQTQA